jgi:hypothetical protein
MFPFQGLHSISTLRHSRSSENQISTLRRTTLRVVNSTSSDGSILPVELIRRSTLRVENPGRSILTEDSTISNHSIWQDLQITTRRVVRRCLHPSSAGKWGAIVTQSAAGQIEHFGTVGWIAAATTLASLWLAGRVRIVDSSPVSAEAISIAVADKASADAGEPILDCHSNPTS